MPKTFTRTLYTRFFIGKQRNTIPMTIDVRDVLVHMLHLDDNGLLYKEEMVDLDKIYTIIRLNMKAHTLYNI